eukprot:166947-Rhodomonas_salina.2
MKIDTVDVQASKSTEQGDSALPKQASSGESLGLQLSGGSLVASRSQKITALRTNGLANRVKRRGGLSIFLATSAGVGIGESRAIQEACKAFQARWSQAGLTVTIYDFRGALQCRQHIAGCLHAIDTADIFIGVLQGAKRPAGAQRDSDMPCVKCANKLIRSCAIDHPLLHGFSLSDHTVEWTVELQFKYAFMLEPNRYLRERGGKLQHFGPCVCISFCEISGSETQGHGEDARDLVEQLAVLSKQGHTSFDFFLGPFDLERRLSAQISTLPVPANCHGFELRHSIMLARQAQTADHQQSLVDYVTSVAGDFDFPLVITSAPGGGKSTLVASAFNFGSFFSEGPDADYFCKVCYFIGASRAHQSLVVMLNHLIENVATILDISDEQRKKALDLGSNEKVTWIIQEWMQSEQGKTLVILLDDMDALQNDVYELESPPHHLHWLSYQGQYRFPRIVRFVVSVSSEGRCLDILDQRCSDNRTRLNLSSLTDKPLQSKLMLEGLLMRQSYAISDFHEWYVSRARENKFSRGTALFLSIASQCFMTTSGTSTLEARSALEDLDSYVPLLPIEMMCKYYELQEARHHVSAQSGVVVGAVKAMLVEGTDSKSVQVQIAPTQRRVLTHGDVVEVRNDKQKATLLVMSVVNPGNVGVGGVKHRSSEFFRMHCLKGIVTNTSAWHNSQVKIVQFGLLGRALRLLASSWTGLLLREIVEVLHSQLKKLGFEQSRLHADINLTMSSILGTLNWTVVSNAGILNFRNKTFRDAARIRYLWHVQNEGLAVER